MNVIRVMSALALLSLGACAYKAPVVPSGAAGTTAGTGSGTAGTGSGIAGTGSGESGTGASGTTGAAGDGAAGTGSGESGTGASGTTGGAGTGGQPDAAAGMNGTDGPTGQAGTGGASTPKNPSFNYTKITVHNRFLAESIAVGDFNKDGTLDLAAGKRWYAGPFAPGYNTAMGEHVYREGHDDLPVTGIAEEINTGVSDSWSAFGYDINADGWDDIIQISASDIGPVVSGQTRPIPFGTGNWYQNPKGAAGNWPRYQISADMKGEHKGYADMTGDGKPEILGACKSCTPAQTWGYWEANWANPTAPWTYHAVTRMYQFKDNCCGWLHGLGAGDVNGDGKMDLLERSGVWLQPATGTGAWTFYNTAFSIPEFLGIEPDIGGSNMYAYDVDGDGMSDVVSSSNSHGYGLAWFKQGPAGKFTRNMIFNTPAEKAMYGGVAFSQLHSLVLEDMDGDGVKDIVTGKTFLAHPFTTGDAGGAGSAGVGTEPTVLYVFKLVRTPTVHFEPHLIDVDSATQKSSGVAREFRVADMNKDGILDIVIASKRGVFVFLGKP
jgi:hypothetical protein